MSALSASELAAVVETTVMWLAHLVVMTQTGDQLALELPT
jgi:hypothetical protein